MAIILRMTFQAFGNGAATTIEVNSATFDAAQTLNIGSQSTGAGAGAGKVVFNPFSFTKKPDGHSAEFWSRLCSGTPFQKVVFGAASSATETPFFSFTMGLVAVKTVSFSASEGSGLPLETITLEYGQAAYSVAPQNADGTFGKAVAAGWDRVKNVVLDPAKVGTL